MTYIAKKQLYRLIFAGLLVVLAVLMILFSTVGSASISFGESARILISHIPFIRNFINAENINKTYESIIINIRMPRIILSVIAGTGLSVVGAAFQGIFRNPMADPYMLGTSSGAALGASVGIVLQSSILADVSTNTLSIGITSIGAFAGAIITTIVVYGIARVVNRVPTTTLILAGVAVNFLTSSGVSFIMMFKPNHMEKIMFWTMGSFSAGGWNQILVLFPVVLIGTVFISMYARDLNIIATGSETAKTLGVDADRVKKILLAVSSALIAVIVSFTGIIGFAGLVVPHIIRLILGPDHRVVIPFSALAGAIFMLICDTVARTVISPSEIPVGLITSLLGAPFFIYLLISSKKKVKI